MIEIGDREEIWVWRCPCGAHGGGGIWKTGVEEGATEHRLRKPVGHPTPEVVSEGTKTWDGKNWV